MTEDTRRKISETLKRKGIEPQKKFIGFGADHPRWKGGMPRCSDCGVVLRDRYSKRCTGCHHAQYRGDKVWNWKGGVRTETQLIRGSVQYRQWRKAVFKRDNYTCQFCGARGVQLNADHVKRFSDYPELRFDLDNGRTLCEPCHKTTDTYAGRGTSKKAQLCQ